MATAAVRITHRRFRWPSPARALSSLESAIAESTKLLSGLDVPFALVGGLAVGAWTEPRFTQDVDFAVAVRDDSEAEFLIRRCHTLGYALVGMVEQDAVGRLATARLVGRANDIVIDLLFASSGIEPEIATQALSIEIAPGLVMPVAQAGHLIAMKVLSHDSERRPQDAMDLKNLIRAADSAQMELARQSLELIIQRGFHRGRALTSLFDSFAGR